MPDKIQETQAPLQQAPVIISEVRLNYTDLFLLNQSIIKTIIESDVDVMSKTALLERILPNLAQAGSCSCSCSCACSCDGGGSVAARVQSGRIQG